MVGVDALGARLSEDRVYRHDIAARILKIPPKSIITPDHISTLIFHPKRGYVWPIVSFTKKEMHVKKVSVVVFLNKCDLLKDWNRDLWIQKTPSHSLSSRRHGEDGSIERKDSSGVLAPSSVDSMTESSIKAGKQQHAPSSGSLLPSSSSCSAPDVVTSQTIKAFFKEIPHELKGCDGTYRIHKVAGSLKEGILRHLK
ncbi:hypothetical protein ADUPG1_006358 [Aduncisulcus paluster]|uniref:Uncharacterized protein n=1 Tax=Aduncisulcus paluster TaxID=2918883 RepID=A0ABQ5KI01_9EUKA|nr:hypothetical protein ADUPG1_006358 [Aduncisulcus paluster]